ncbi:MAG TPA: hypothetical protein VL997_05355 [Dyella sp.]|nr:hypothetical protein [Dyella sp.]
MIELEVQALSHSREGLLIDIGKSMVAQGFALVRQRLVDDANGVLLTMVVRGPSRKQRALESALDALPRIISFEISPHVQGESKPHFAASRSVASGYVPPPTPSEVVTETGPAAAKPSVSTTAVPKAPPQPAENIEPPAHHVPAMVEPRPAASSTAPLMAAEPEPDFIFVRPSTPSQAPAAVPLDPFVEVTPLDPDVQAVENMLPALMSSYPKIFPLVKELERTVAEGARESTLQWAGQRMGAWTFERNHAAGSTLSVEQALDSIGVPAMRLLVEIDHKGNQLHIRNSPLCTEEGRSNCKFFSGYLEGLLGPLVASQSLSIFEVCCRSCGATECVLAIMD